ncbi:hypothetical protein QWJ34_06660 [Saccharibacillus sp. CPCC 101409]|uniref:hypothetical protein n=1 Tax=Saccharibacillus sp. CPCC 101409 TaxID=3058041 RepID=UPI002671B79B|nr:hypothetical protein [Saccharibacillus sp. CPCC 101409]MDO3409438.1 hypothetical protein [Saccharibacillus sp. CPCC 101409]
MELSSFFANSDLSGVLCMESASHLNRQSTFPSLPVMVFAPLPRDYNMGYLQMYAQAELDLRFTRKVGHGLYLTSPERTIVDLLRFDREERVLFESLDRYLREHRNTNALLKVAKEYGCLNELKQRIVELDEWLSEFYEHG